MDTLKTLNDFAPFLLGLLLAGSILWGVDWALRKFLAKRVVARHLSMLVLTGVLFVVTLAALPIEDSVRHQLLQLLGLVATGAFAFSSTTFVSNAVAGFMLRAVRNFEPGDFIRVGDHFGRVSERGLFHTEIQTEDSDLMTLPNLYLASNPVKVVRSSGTIVSVMVSLGYDVSRKRIEKILLESAGAVGLERPSVRIRDLLDHAVVYRVAGWLSDVSELPFAGGRLRGAALDALHGAGIEIASPSLRSHRALADHVAIIPKPEPMAPEVSEQEPSAEETAFDKAEQAGRVTKLREEVEKLDGQIEELEGELEDADSPRTREDVDALIARRDEVTALLGSLEDNESE